LEYQAEVEAESNVRNQLMVMMIRIIMMMMMMIRMMMMMIIRMMMI
jgi:hypothetical protein